jgi:tRNA(Ile)-lysidine synthase
MPDQLEVTVAEFIRRHGLFAGAGGILLAVSGGADSITLLHVLVALKTQGWIEPDLVYAHINHQLRGPASDADEQFASSRQAGSEYLWLPGPSMCGGTPERTDCR